MNKLPFTALSLLLSLSPLRADPVPEIPGPALAQPPNPGHWKESYVFPETTPPSGKPEPRPELREIVLFGATRREIVTWSGGKTTERWIVNGVLFSPSSEPSSEGEPLYIRDSRMDPSAQVPSLALWPGLGWYHTGLKPSLSTYKGRECLLVEDAEDAHRLRVDSATRLPLAVEEADRETVFTFLPAPTAEPTPNGTYAATIAAYRKKLAGMTVNTRPR